MTKPRLTELLKARVDPGRKQCFELLTSSFGYTDESDTVRRACDEFIERHSELLPKLCRPRLGVRL